MLRATRASEHQALFSALQAAETWNETGSALALRELGAYTDATPVASPSDRRH